MSNGDEAAFPVPVIRRLDGEIIDGPYCGITKRELFAAMILGGVVHNTAHWRAPLKSAEMAVQYADALLAELEGKK